MRIIAGKFRGRRLRGPRGHELRPTSDRLRETLFDILGDRVTGCAFVDAFAGTGAVGLEALSRGAREVVFIDSDTTSIRLIRQNLELCGVSDNCQIIHREADAAIRLLGKHQFSCDFIYLDPPYHWVDYSGLMKTVFQRGPVRPSSTIILEHHIKAPVPGDTEIYRCTRVVRQGDHGMSFFAFLNHGNTGEAGTNSALYQFPQF